MDIDENWTEISSFLLQRVRQLTQKQAVGEMSPFNNVEAMTSGGTKLGLSQNLEGWIRND